jgi:hypothetical protein
MGSFVEVPYCDKIILTELNKIKHGVLTKDKDFVVVYDGEEGVGKSVLAMQHAKILDPNFCIDDIVFNSKDFIKKIKDINTKKGKCILLDEAYSSASARQSLSDVNKSMVALATEMRQCNLFVIIVLPSFFDLDRYFALWRCKALFHVYYNEEQERRYIAFDKTTKKLLYLSGKKTYDYSYPRAPFPPSKFYNEYVIDELAYREKKSKAFRGRPISLREQKQILQRNALIRFLMEQLKYTSTQLNLLFRSSGAEEVDHTVLSRILSGYKEEGGDLEVIEKKT